MLTHLNVDEKTKLYKHIVAHMKHPFSEPGPERLRFMVLALCGEAGELANYVKKEWRGDDLDDEWQKKVTSEVADIGNYIFMIAEILGLDLPQIMLNKLIEVENRPNWKGPKS